MADLRKSYPCSGPYPLKVSLLPNSSIAAFIASRAANGKGSVTSPIPHRMICLAPSGLLSVNKFTLRAISGKRYPALSFK